MITISIAYVHPADAEAAAVRRELDATASALNAAVARIIDARYPISEAPGDAADRLFDAFMALAEPLAMAATMAQRKALAL
jgi:hypothetical protein